jgi:hypothetical protein
MNVMRFSIVVIVLSSLGCGPVGQPVGWRPSDSEVLGSWKLANSPSVSVSPNVIVPAKGQSTIFLATKGVAKITNVLVEETYLPAGKTPPYSYRSTLKTEDAAWQVTEKQGAWVVELLLTNRQNVLFRIRARDGDKLELNYQPDPEGEAFIYRKE